MKAKIFDVVELTNEKKAIIVTNEKNNTYMARVIENGQETIENIISKDINKIIKRSNIHKR